METAARAISLLCLAALAATAAPPAERKYTTRYDGVDVDAILKNERLYRSYVDCIVAQEGAKVRCTKDAIALRSRIPDALASDCAKCSERQREETRKVVAFVRKNHPEDWSALVRRFDPTGVYSEKHGDRLKHAA
ncbi:ejaculatory bulb-specific protein 3-like isoform X2 [Bacillus rossius redtenbacheri]